MYFSRHIDQVLLDWRDAPNRKPLILRGARQTGKSSSIRQFGRQFDLFLELNLDRFEDQRLVRSCRSAEDLLTALSTRHDLVDFPESSLLFLDEIQEVPETIPWLRYLREDHPDLAVIAAGSLLEVHLDRGGFSFPVGRVTFRTLRPMSFFEFLGALEKNVLADRLRAGVAADLEDLIPVHEQTLDLLQDYLLVGGLPEAVRQWVETRESTAVGRVHSDLWQALAEDIHKYRGDDDLDVLQAAFESLHLHYGKRFRFENFAPGFKSRTMQAALGKLEAAHLATCVLPTSSLSIPLAHRHRSAAKLLPLDVGLALYGMVANLRELRTRALDEILDGTLAEIFVGQQILKATRPLDEPLFFWVSESSTANSEVDFLVTQDGAPVPVEVKAGASGSLKSMHQFLSRASLDLGVRFHSGLAAHEVLEVGMPDTSKLRYELLSLPLYLAELLPEALAARLG